jgi:hypothetical protein
VEDKNCSAVQQFLFSGQGSTRAYSIPLFKFLKKNIGFRPYTCPFAPRIRLKKDGFSWLSDTME